MWSIFDRILGPILATLSSGVFWALFHWDLVILACITTEGNTLPVEEPLQFPLGGCLKSLALPPEAFISRLVVS